MARGGLNEGEKLEKGATVHNRTLSSIDYSNTAI